MRALALLLARPTWAALLWFMRRRWMRYGPLWPMKFMSEERAAVFLRRHYAQNRFARRIGLPLLTIAFEALLASFVLMLTYQLALKLIEKDFITPPSLENRFPNRSSD